MFDWAALTNDPNDKAAGVKLQAFLASLLAYYSVSRSDFLREYFRSARVLDIGAGEHDPSYYHAEKWEHGIISKVAAYDLGVDINPAVCEHYNKAGFRFTCVDATSDADLGERFDRVFMGDVIEHVNNPVALLQFAKRHLSPGGRMLITTPNPFSFSFLTARTRDKNRSFLLINYEHMCWITPTNANELARRSGLRFTKIYFPRRALKSIHSFKSFTKAITERLMPVLGVPELGAKEFIYEFSV